MTGEFIKVSENDFETALVLTVLLSGHMKAVFVSNVLSDKKQQHYGSQMYDGTNVTAVRYGACPCL